MISGRDTALLTGALESDLLRITVVMDGLLLTGWEVSEILQQEHAVIPELASLKVCMDVSEATMQFSAFDCCMDILC